MSGRKRRQSPSVRRKLEGVEPIAKEEFTSRRFELLYRAAQAELSPSALRILMATASRWMHRENGGAFYASLTTICAELGIRRTAARTGLADLVAAQIFSERKFPGETSLFLPVWTEPNPSANANGSASPNPSANANRSRPGNPSNFANRFRVVTSGVTRPNPSANANHHRFANADDHPSANADTTPYSIPQRDNSDAGGAALSGQPSGARRANDRDCSLRSDKRSPMPNTCPSPHSASRLSAASAEDERDIYAARECIPTEPATLEDPPEPIPAPDAMPDGPVPEWWEEAVEDPEHEEVDEDVLL